MPVEDERQPSEEEQTGPKKPRIKSPKAKKLMSLGIGILAIVFAIASAFYVTQMLKAPKDKKGSEPNADISKTPAIYIKLNEFTVNLKSEGQYLETEMYLQADNDKVKDEISKKMPEIRDGINSILMSKTMNDILSSDGKDQLKVEIKDSLNKNLTSGAVTNVHFTSFLMQ